MARPPPGAGLRGSWVATHSMWVWLLASWAAAVAGIRGEMSMDQSMAVVRCWPK